MRQQLAPLFEKFQSNIRLQFCLDESKVSQELRGFAKEMDMLTHRVSCEEIQGSEESGRGELPSIRLCKEDGTYLGTSFHGIPGGHEFNSFLISMYNAAGPGQPIEPELLARIRELKKAIPIQVVVSLSCTMCPDLVMAVQRIALENAGIQADIYDMAHFPQLREKYQIMSVPCMIIDKKDVFFGKKGIQEIIQLLE